MDETPNQLQTFSYEAQTQDGRAMSGTLEATDHDAARRHLEAMGLRLISMNLHKPPRAKALSGTDFVVFNQQLAQMTKAGLPLERGMRLIAQDIRNRGLPRTIGLVADEMEKGRTMSDAFDAHRGRFPSFYGRLVEAGIKTGNLSAVLFSFGRHLELMNRLRAGLWQAASYPLIVLLFVIFVLGFVSFAVLPGFQDIFDDFDATLPPLTEAILATGRVAPIVLAVVLILIVASPLLWRVLMLAKLDRHVIDEILFKLPLIGSVLKRNMIARWCDTLKIAVAAGMDLPASIELASDAVGSPRMAKDGRDMIEAVNAGTSLGERTDYHVLPATIGAAIDLSRDTAGLASTLEALSEMYQQQAELRLGTVQVVIGPLLLALLAVVMGLVIMGLFMPLVKLIQTMT